MRRNNNMTNIESTIIEQIKEMLTELIDMVTSQMELAKSCLFEGNDDDRDEILEYEKRINSLELSIDRECERFMARYNPVATDLRFVISILKSTIYLERMGDNAERMTAYLEDIGKPYAKEVLTKLSIDKMIDLIVEMLSYLSEAYNEMDVQKARKAYHLDKKINKLNIANIEAIEKYLTNNSKNVKECMYLFSTTKKLERSGDYCKHIAEELLFYINAKVMRHKKIKKK